MTVRDLRFLLLGFIVALFFLVLSARAHSLPHKQSMTLTERRDFQLRTLHHDLSVERFFRRHVKAARTWRGRQSRRWHRAQKRWTRRELQETFSALEAVLIPHKAAWLCIYRYERGSAGWATNTGNGYYGGLQMDWSFMRAYGRELLRRKGTADKWTPAEQMMVAERAHRSGRGFNPWPNTARRCGLL
jgi:hypothetical protein